MIARPTIPPDDLQRNPRSRWPNETKNCLTLHWRATPTPSLTGKDTTGRYCLITCLSRQVAALLHTATISRDVYHSRRREVTFARNPWCRPARASIPANALTTFTTPPAAGATAVPVFASRAGRVRRPLAFRRESHRSVPKTRRGRPSGAQSEAEALASLPDRISPSAAMTATPVMRAAQAK
jgi:hypothetical protein